MSDSKEANPELKLEVNEMILDYLLFKATQAALRAAQGESSTEAERLLQSFDAFSYVFHAHHPEHTLSRDQVIGIKLLRLVTLLAVRRDCIPMTGPSRSLDHQQYPRWMAHRPCSEPTDPPNIVQDREKCLQAIVASMKSRTAVAASEVVVPSLMDILRPFLSLSAEIAARHDQKIYRDWMRLAAEMMLQAGLEQSYKEDRKNLDDIDAIFAWRWTPEPSLGSPEPDKELDLINEMFCDRDEEGEVPGWNDIRGHFKAIFFAIEGRDWTSHLEIIGQYFPREEFEGKLVAYVEDIFIFQRDYKKPILVQLEDGSLEDFGLDHDQTMELIRRGVAI